MGAATGIAGSKQPEQQGTFLCETEREAIVTLRRGCIRWLAHREHRAA
jgi:hypothetical protein